MAEIIIPNYRIGNDLPISFFVEINEGGMVLSDANTTILFYDPYGHQAEVRWSISGNQVSGTFLGKDQKRTGLYTLKVILNKGEAGMGTSDRQMFRLVPHTWDADTEPGGWEGFTVTMTDVISVQEMEEIRDIINQGFPDLEGRVNAAIEESQRINTEIQELEQRIEGTETLRAEAEQGRVDAEALRVQAEQGRADAEEGRVTEEGKRVVAEQDRVSAEENRVTEEDKRVLAEKDRSDAEGARVQAEQGRADAEALRVQAEQGRVSAENARVLQASSDHSRAVDDHTLAASDHTQAGNDHTQAGNDHTQAAADHQTASSDHTLAAADHETASNDHALAGSDHTTAAADHTQAGNDHTASTTATGAANDAAALANDKAALAVEKAALADEKATEAGNVNATLNGTEITVTNRYGVSVTQNIKGDKGNPGTTDYEQLVHKPDLTVYVTAAEYDETTHYLKFKNSEGTVITSVDAAPFIKDGMVDSVEVTGGNLVITFNTDAGKQAISIPLTAIFNPANYYDKTATDALLLDKLGFETNSNPASLFEDSSSE